MNKIFENERTFRHINEDVRDSLEDIAPTGIPRELSLELYCECPNRLCHERVSITPSSYEGIHRNPLRFMVKPNHYLPQFERVVRKTDDYWVIEKIEDELEKPFEL